MEEIRRYV